MLDQVGCSRARLIRNSISERFCSFSPKWGLFWAPSRIGWELVSTYDIRLISTGHSGADSASVNSLEALFDLTKRKSEPASNPMGIGSRFSGLKFPHRFYD